LWAGLLAFGSTRSGTMAAPAGTTTDDIFSLFCSLRGHERTSHVTT
jgi:hypothetical protein